MQNYKCNRLVSDENSVFSISIISVIGDREEQQDSFGYALKSNEGIVVICDGMGGHEGGQLASNIAVECFLSDYNAHYPSDNVNQLMLDSAHESDKKIAALVNSSGKPMNAGSTAVAIVIKNNCLYWCSVGDSRAYLLRKDEFVQVTKDQNYRVVLDEKLHAGIITASEYQSEEKKGEGLISYLGIGNLSLIDYNNVPLKLQSEDKIILMSDGLYKLVTEPEIKRLLENFENSAEALRALDAKAKSASKKSEELRDNMTVSIIKIK